MPDPREVTVKVQIAEVESYKLLLYQLRSLEADMHAVTVGREAKEFGERLSHALDRYTNYNPAKDGHQ